jgi:hypothetical protein
MKLVLLKTSNVPPLPKGLKITADWGHVSIVGDDGALLANGEHVMVSGTKKKLQDWLRPLASFWVQEPGTFPAMQRFVVGHIPE